MSVSINSRAPGRSASMTATSGAVTRTISSARSASSVRSHSSAAEPAAAAVSDSASVAAPNTSTLVGNAPPRRSIPPRGRAAGAAAPSTRDGTRSSVRATSPISAAPRTAGPDRPRTLSASRNASKTFSNPSTPAAAPNAWIRRRRWSRCGAERGACWSAVSASRRASSRRPRLATNCARESESVGGVVSASPGRAPACSTMCRPTTGRPISASFPIFPLKLGAFSPKSVTSVSDELARKHPPRRPTKAHLEGAFGHGYLERPSGKADF